MGNYTNGENESGIHLSRNMNINRPVEQPRPDWEQLKRELDEETTVYKAPELSKDYMGTASKAFTKITGFLMYVALVVLVLSCVWYFFHDMSGYRKQLPVIGVAYILSGVIFTIDAVVINHGYKQNKSLYVFAWVLNFIYPFQRSNHLMRKSPVADYVLAAIAVLGFAGVGYHTITGHCQYKAVYMVEDEKERQEVEALFSQDADGVALGKQLYKSFHVSGVAVYENERVSKIVLIGNSNHIVDPALKGKTDVKWNIKENLFVDNGSCNVPTQLIFIRGVHNTEYRLSTVKIEDESLLPSYIYNYWRKVILRWDEYAQRVD